MLEGVASASLDVLQATALVAFLMCFLATMVFVVLTAMAAPLKLAVELLRKPWKKKMSAEAWHERMRTMVKDALIWLFTWLALYGFYVYLTAGLA